jgi:peptidyl-prolyl cis-trans isomerase SurA
MKRVLWAIPLIISMSWNADAAKIVDRIVAQVNDEIITLSDLNRALVTARQELSQKFAGDQLEQEMKRAQKVILDELIEQKLLLQKASELGFGKDVEVQVSAAVERIRKENNIKDMQEFEKALAQQGMTMAEFRDGIKKQYITNGLIQEFVNSRITLLSQEIEKYYKNHASEFSTPEEVTLSEIYIPYADNRPEAEARAAEIRKRLDSGEAFASLVTQYSKGPTASRGGGIGTYITAKLNPDMVAAIAKVKEGGISAVTPGKDGISIYRVDSRKETSMVPLEEVRDDIKNRLWKQKFDPELKRYITQLKEDAYIRIFDEIKQ